MKVIKLIAENFKRLKAVEIVPAGNMVTITGANEQGKTSVLDALWAAIGGATASKSTGTIKPIRDGSENASVTADLGDLIVTRKWSASGSTLTVENREGAVFKGPQAVLDSIVGKIAFDPLAFANMDDMKQRETLLELVDIGIDLEDLAVQRESLYSERTFVNKTVKGLQANIGALPIIPSDTPDEETPIKVALDKISAAQKKQNENDAIRREYTTQSNQLARIKTTIAGLEAELVKAKNVLLEKEKEFDNLSKMALELVDPDIEKLKDEARDVEAINEYVRQKNLKSVLAAQLKTAESDSKRLTDEIEALDKKKETALKSAKYPIDGLGFNDRGVTLNGIPFSQCSSAERLKTSIAMAMAMNPKLKVIRITDGSLIDKRNMAIIEEMVKDKDFQCWIERVDETGKVGIFIEDGEVKAVEQPSIEKALS